MLVNIAKKIKNNFKKAQTLPIEMYGSGELARSSNFSKKWKAWLWVGLQGLALFCILFAPLYLDQSIVRIEAKPAERDESAEKKSDEEKASFQSRVLELYPPGHPMWEQHPYIYVSVSKQVRFEFPEYRESTESIRKPASQTTWVVRRLMRDLGNDVFEELSLISNEEGRVISSPYTELYEPKNRFRLEYQNAKDKELLQGEFVIYRDSP